MKFHCRVHGMRPRSSEGNDCLNRSAELDLFFPGTKTPMKTELENGYHQHPIVPIVTSYRRNGK